MLSAVAVAVGLGGLTTSLAGLGALPASAAAHTICSDTGPNSDLVAGSTGGNAALQASADGGIAVWLHSPYPAPGPEVVTELNTTTCVQKSWPMPFPDSYTMKVSADAQTFAVEDSLFENISWAPAPAAGGSTPDWRAVPVPDGLSGRIPRGHEHRGPVRDER